MFPTNPPTSSRKRLIKPADLSPWISAETLVDTFLHWLPVNGFPLLHEEREWFLDFMERFTALLESREGLRCETFLQTKTAGQEPSDVFRRYVVKNKTLQGLTRKPKEILPRFPSSGEMKRALSGSNPAKIEDWVPDFCYWFLGKQAAQHRDHFAGLGGMNTLYLAPDPATKPPALPFTPKFRAAMPVFKAFDVDSIMQGAYAMADSFMPKSKQVFARGLEDDAMYPGIAFVVPLLDSGHFFAATAEERSEWFTVFDVYLHESPADKGIVLAFQRNFEPHLQEVLEAMRAANRVYPTR